MEHLDAKVFGAIAFFTFFLVEALKFFFPKTVSGKEEQVAAVLPIIFAVGAKALGYFTATPWEEVLLWAIGGGAASGAGHDKVYVPLKKLVLRLFGKKAPEAAPPAEPPKG